MPWQTLRFRFGFCFFLLPKQTKHNENFPARYYSYFLPKSHRNRSFS